MALSSTSNYASSGFTYLAADVANGGTVTMPYPAGTTQASFTGGNAGSTADNMAVIGQDKFVGSQVGFTYGASNITITNNSGVTWASSPIGGYAAGRCIFGYPRLDPTMIYNGPKAGLS